MRLRKLIVAAGIITAMSIAMATSVFADSYVNYQFRGVQINGEWKVRCFNKETGEMLTNQWLLGGVAPMLNLGNQAYWFYLDSEGEAVSNVTTPDGYPIDGSGCYYTAPTEADLAAVEARQAYNSSSTTTTATTTNNTTSTTTTQTATSGSYMDIGTEEFNNELIDLINDYRAANGLKRLKKTSDAMSAAETRALELTYSYNRWHLRPDERVSSSVWDDLGYEITETRTAAENCEIIHKGDTPKSAFEIWKNSSGHNKNMLNSRISEIGIGSCVDPDRDDVYVSMNCK